MERDKYLVKNVLLFSLNEIGTRLITFFLVPIYTTALSTWEYGITDLVTKIINLLVPIVTLNIRESIMRFCLDKEADYNRIMSIGLLSIIPEIFISLLVFPIIGFFPELYNYRNMIFICCVTNGFFQLFSSYLRGKEELKGFAACNILHIFLISICNIFFLLVFKMGVKGYFLSFIISDLVASFISVIVGHVVIVIRHFSIDTSLLRSMLKFSLPMIPNSVSWWVMNYMDSTMITKMIGSAANGIYAVSYKLPTIVSVMSNVFNRAWTFSAIKEDSSLDKQDYNNKTFSSFVSFQVLVAAFLLLIIKPFTPFYVRKEAYFDSWKYAPYLIIGNFFLSIAAFLSTYYAVNKDSKGYLYSGAVGAIANVTLNSILIPKIGLYGAALSTAVSYLCVLVYSIFDTKKYITLEFVTSKRLLSCGLLLVMFTIMYLNIRYEIFVLFVFFIIIVILEKDIIIFFLKILYNILIKRTKRFF